MFSQHTEAFQFRPSSRQPLVASAADPASQSMNPGNAALAASLLEIERDRLLCSLQHLERSVKELKQALIEHPDPEYKTAISENLVVIAKQRARVQSLEDEIRRAKGMKGDISHAQVAAVPVQDTPAVQQQQGQAAQQQSQNAAAEASAASHAAAAQAGASSIPQAQQHAPDSRGTTSMDVDYADAAAAAQANGQQQQQQQQGSAQAAAGGDSSEGMWL